MRSRKFVTLEGPANGDAEEQKSQNGPKMVKNDQFPLVEGFPIEILGFSENVENENSKSP